MDFRENAVERLVLPFFMQLFENLKPVRAHVIYSFYSSMNGHSQIYFIELNLWFSDGKIYTSI